MDAGPFLPDSNRTGVTIGGGFRVFRTFEFQFSSPLPLVPRAHDHDSRDNFNATYKTFAILPSVGMKTTF